MTKHVRIENADISDFKLEVQVWDKAQHPGEPDTLADTIPLHYPCSQAMPYVTSTRYLVVREVVEVPVEQQKLPIAE